MRSTFSLLPYINRSKVKADGTTAVLCRITIDGKQTAISTGIYCRPEDWNSKKNEIKTIRENNRLREYLRLTEEAYNEILKLQGVVSAEILKNHITLQAQLLELRYDKKNKYSDYAKLFAACWPVIHILSGQGALLFIKFMPHIHSIRGRLEEVSDALSQILEAPVKVRPKMVQRTIRAQKPNRLGNMRLGANSVNVGVLNSAEADLHIHISDLPTREVERFLPGNRSRKALEMLADIFLGAWQEFDVTVSVSPDERKTYLKPTGDASPCYLGINTYL